MSEDSQREITEMELELVKAFGNIQKSAKKKKRCLFEI